jgi:hypothetical protein
VEYYNIKAIFNLPMITTPEDATMALDTEEKMK